MGRVSAALAPYLQVLPLSLTLALPAVPILIIVVVSFWDYDFVRVSPTSS